MRARSGLSQRPFRSFAERSERDWVLMSDAIEWLTPRSENVFHLGGKGRYDKLDNVGWKTSGVERA